ncbi:glycoside hydrolase family 38 C-terminal domain-containing protein [Bacteroides sp. CG01]|uniref:glycoside hydrolase family 38 N-terminal domain-containing protein n=1 Tax=Bacteroides sp. CG01 TaxID=3096000 RepID=UPI002AFFEAAA|nr:glycoside hydrolase family 38 C-terminal domain-containing protein [Bacteroides sp. CG01]
MRKIKWFVFLLTYFCVYTGHINAQADNYKKHENDDVEQVSTQEMDFYLVFKSHFDIGYSALARDVINEYRTFMIDKAMDVIDRNTHKMKDEQFVWTIPGWPLKQMLWDKQTPERRLRIEKALKNGNLVTHALPYTTHTETLEVEDLVRGLGYSSMLARQYGLALPIDAKMTDVPGHTWILPTILHHAGIKFFHMGANPTNQEINVPTLFWWEGPDGSRVLTMFSKGYGGGMFPPEGWKHKSWLTFVHAGDNAGPPTAEKVEQTIKHIKEKYPKAKIHIGKMADFAEAIFTENPTLPIIRGDISDSWVHGVMSSPNATRIARRVRPLIPALETLHTQVKEWGIMSYEIDEELAYVYDQSLMFGEHTWGLANQHFVPGMIGKEWNKMYLSGLSPAYAHMEESWREHANYINHAEQVLRPELERELYTLADNVAQDGLRFVVYNPLPWRRSGMVNFAMPTQGSIRAEYIKEVGTNKIYELKVYGNTSNRLGTFFAEDIPANGYKTYVLTDRTTEKTHSTLKGNERDNYIENKWYKITFDVREGCIKSVWDKINRRELIDTESTNKFGSYIYERYDQKQSLQYLKEYIFDGYKKSHYSITGKSSYLDKQAKACHKSPRQMEFYVENHKSFIKGMLIPSLSLGEGQHTAGLVVTLYENLPYIDLKLNVVNKPATEEAEAGWLSLPFKMDNPEYRIGRVGSVIDPTKDLIEGSQFNYIWSNSGIMIKDTDYSVGICPLDAPAFVMGNLNFMHFSPKYENPQSHIYLNLFNNRWNTNFTSFWSGNLTSEVRIWVNYEQDNDESGLITPAWEARLPLQIGIATTPGGKLPTSREGIKVSQKGVLVTAYGKNPDGNGKLLRLWENAGNSGGCEVTLPTFVDGIAQPVNLRGVPEGMPIPIKQGTFKIKLNKFAPHSYLIW